MKVSDLLEEVDRRVAERIIPLLLREAIDRHVHSKEWKSCDCSYCSLRKRAALHISSNTFPSNVTIKKSSVQESILELGSLRTRRELIRQHFRSQLDEMINEI